ncbi:MAG TPA: Xaa-Pro peptidase family protein [Bryobacteraceae bacterium]
MAYSEFASNRHRATAALEDRKLDAMIVSAAPNVRYLTGFTGSNGWVLLWASGAVLLTDPRYEIQASEQTDCAVRVVRGPFYADVMKAAAKKKLRRIGFESARLTFNAYEQLKAQLPLGAALEPVAGLVDRLRMVKSPREIELIRSSVALNSEAYAKAMRSVRPGMTESQLAASIDHQMRLLGAEAAAFETIVASGARSALPHAHPTGSPIRRNQLLLIDMGASREGYASDMTRMAFLGRPPRRVRELYRAVLESQLAAVEAVRAGVPCGNVDRAARRVLRAAGLEKAFVHSTGHGLGLEIHEAPRLGRREETPLSAGMVVTVEPGAYLEGLGGVRIEDTVLVTASGCEILTPTSKDLLLM